MSENKDKLPMHTYSEGKNNIVVIIEQFKKRSDLLTENARGMMFNVISSEEGIDLFEVLYRNKDTDKILDILKSYTEDENNLVNLFVSGIVCNKTDLLEMLEKRTEISSKINRIKVIHCLQSMDQVDAIIDKSDMANLSNVIYDVERIHQYFDVDHQEEVVREIFEVDAVLE